MAKNLIEKSIDKDRQKIEMLNIADGIYNAIINEDADELNKLIVKLLRKTKVSR